MFGPAIVYSVPHVLSSDHEAMASDWSLTQIPASNWPPSINRGFAQPATLPINTNTHSLNNPPSDVSFIHVVSYHLVNRAS